MTTIWGLLIFPAIITIFIALIDNIRKKVTWWEVAILWASVIITIFTCQIVTLHSATNDFEYWGFNSISAYYDEPYEYWTTCSETYQCGTTCSGSGKTRRCSPRYCTRHYPCTKWAGDRGYIIDQTDNTYYVDKNTFDKIASKWNNKKFVELNREKTKHIETDGDRWITTWPKTWKTSIPLTEKHIYENRVNNSTTICFRKVTEDDKKFWKLIDYPKLNSNMDIKTVIDNSGKLWPNADLYFGYINGILGPEKFGRVIVLIFRNSNRDTFEWQKDYWKNGNKNEFIICIGADDENNILWGDVFSWTEVESLKIEIRDFIENEMIKLNEESLYDLALFSEKELFTKYVKPEFTEKFSHLSIEPSTKAKIICLVIVLCVCGGVTTFIVFNDIDCTN